MAVFLIVWGLTDCRQPKTLLWDARWIKEAGREMTTKERDGWAQESYGRVIISHKLGIWMQMCLGLWMSLSLWLLLLSHMLLLKSVQTHKESISARGDSSANGSSVMDMTRLPLLDYLRLSHCCAQTQWPEPVTQSPRCLLILDRDTVELGELHMLKMQSNWNNAWHTVRAKMYTIACENERNPWQKLFIRQPMVYVYLSQM